jgi:hypothetical protein
MRWGWLLVLLATGCTPVPQWYPVPYQRVLTVSADPPGLGEFISFSSRAAQEHVVAEVLEGSPNDVWRWTNQNPTLRFFLLEPDGWRFQVNFALAESTWKSTGPVGLRVVLNGQVLGSATGLGQGRHEKSWAVPAAMVKPKAENIVRLELDKVLVAEGDGVKLGMILEAAGFKKP